MGGDGFVVEEVWKRCERGRGSVNGGCGSQEENSHTPKEGVTTYIINIFNHNLVSELWH